MLMSGVLIPGFNERSRKKAVICVALFDVIF